MNRYTFPIPTGWLRVAAAGEPAAGQLKAVRFLGRDLVLWRDADGVAHLQDTYCAHLGANIAVGGAVVGNEIQCPFHRWRYGADGRCSHIPYADKPHANARLRTYPVVDYHGALMAWYHPEGLPPDYDLPVIPELESGEFVGPIVQTHSIRTCLQEMAENTVDGAHFQSIHQHPGAAHYDSIVYDGPRMLVKTTQQFPSSRGPVEGFLNVESFGFGLGVVRYRTLIDIVMLATTAAVDADRSEQTNHVWYRNANGDARADRIGEAFAKEVNRQLLEDVPIWENKIYLAHPNLAPGEGDIARFRRWAKQFYVESQAA